MKTAEQTRLDEVREQRFPWMKYLYKYPQAAFPYDNLVLTNAGRNRSEPEYELINTGVFDQDRHFDVFVENAKESPEDTLVQISVHKRGPAPAEIHLPPTLCFRNRWSWRRDIPRPSLQAVTGKAAVRKARDAILEKLYAAKPEAKGITEKAAGYVTFNNKNLNLFFLSSGHGYGMVVDKSGKETFMAMGSLGGGPGLGAKDLSVVFIFKNAEVMKKFIESGWQFGGEADATAKAGDKVL